MDRVGEVENRLVNNASTKEARATRLILNAWNERWTEVKWGDTIRQLADAEEVCSVLSHCILLQALSGPGPIYFPLKLLIYSIREKIVTTSSVLSSVSKYAAFDKSRSVIELLGILDSVKEQINVTNHRPGSEDCMELALALQYALSWLLSCMHFQLKTLSKLDANFTADFEAENLKNIVLKCRDLIHYFLSDPYLFNLIQVANKEDEEPSMKIRSESKKLEPFLEGRHQKEISHVMSLIEKLGVPKNSQVLP